VGDVQNKSKSAKTVTLTNLPSKKASSAILRPPRSRAKPDRVTETMAADLRRDPRRER